MEPTEEHPNHLHAGAAQADITPAANIHLAGRGDGAHRPAQVVLDPLHARATVFQRGDRRLCFLALDVTIVTHEWTDRIRQAASSRWNFDPDAVMVHATQTHSAPPLGHFMLDPDFPAFPPELEYLRGGESAYYEFAVDRAVEAIGMAMADLRPVSVAAGSAVKDGIAFNRRAITREGRVIMPWFYPRQQKPLGPTEIRYMEGTVDPEVGIFCARDADLSVRALLLHYTCHPVNVFALPGDGVSADWPGAWAEGARRACAPQCAPLVLNGCCGNINPWPPFEPDFTPDHRRMGEILTERASAVVSQLQFAPAHHLDWKVRRVPLPLKDPDPVRLQTAEEMLTAHPQPLPAEDDPNRIDPRWYQAASVKSVEILRQREPQPLYEIQAFRVGDVAFVGLPGEPFVEGQLAVKLGSPAHYTFVAHATTQYIGYLPTRQAHERGGHEIDFSYWAKFAPDSLDRVVDNAVELLGELF